MENFEENRLTQGQRDFLDRNTRGTWSVNNEGFVLVDGDFYCYEQGLKDFLGIWFSEVTGHFNCHGNQLTTLQGAPRKVGGYFYCSSNQLTTLQGAPIEIGEDFYCSSNQLETLEGSPRLVGGDFYCHDNQLTTLQGAPSEVGKDFCCSGNRLVSLNGSPEKVGRAFYCRDNQLTTLQGSPASLDGDFYCSENQLSTLEGAPREVGGNFYCHSNRLVALLGSPLRVGGGFYCYDNPLVSLEGITQVISTILFFKVTSFYYNLESFLIQIGDSNPDEISLLLTHHFFTVDVLVEQIDRNPHFTHYVSLAWGTEGFRGKRDELEKILTSDILDRIDNPIGEA